jgi:hypothetical protein
MTAPNNIFWNRFTATITPVIFVVVLLGHPVTRAIAAQEILVENYPSGKIHYKIEVDGAVKVRMNSKHDRLEGESMIYFKNGQVQYIYRYFKGRVWTRKDYSPTENSLVNRSFLNPRSSPEKPFSALARKSPQRESFGI